MKPTKFSFINRGSKRTIVLVPGWASDYRIFDSLDLAGGYLLPVDFSPFGFTESLIRELRTRRIDTVSLFGWSLGGFCAAEFAARYGDHVDELLLVSIREKYIQTEMEAIKRFLKTKKTEFLYKFYTQWFHDPKLMHFFTTKYLKRYCRELDAGFLLTGLDYLSNAELSSKMLEPINRVTIIHGEYDSIAPLEEARTIHSRLSSGRFIRVKNAGHAPFLKNDFNTYIPWLTKR